MVTWCAGHGGLAGNNSDRWAWRRGQQWLRSFLDFIADVERLLEGLLGLQPGPTRGDWYSKGHRLMNALRQIEEVHMSCNTPARAHAAHHAVGYLGVLEARTCTCRVLLC